MSINTATSATFPPPHSSLPSNEQSEIEQNAAKNPINLAVVSTPETQPYDQDLKNLYKLGKAAEKLQEEKPQSLFSKLVQWFNRVLLRRKEDVTAGKNTSADNESINGLSLEKPALIDSRMMDDFIFTIEKFTKIRSDELDELRGEKDLYKMIMKAGLHHYHRMHTHRMNDHQMILDAHKEADGLKSLRNEINIDKIATHKSQKFWRRVNIGLSTACVLTTLARHFNGGAVTNPLTCIMAISSGCLSMVNAQTKQTSEELSGKSKAIEAEFLAVQTMTENELKVLSATAEALLQLFNHLAETNQKHYRVNTMALSDR